MTQPSLIVPISVEALCVNATAEMTNVHFRGAAANFSNLPVRGDDGQMSGDPYLGQSIAQFPAQTLEPGVHLHWALPDALTHGADSDGQGVAFPTVPNRWLVVRLHTRGKDQATAATELKAWIVESDYVGDQPDGFGVSMPFRDAVGQRYYRFLGRSLPLDSWRESMAGGQSLKAMTGEELTAVGYGDIAFAAFYPNCRSVFGFYDDLATLHDYSSARDSLSYMVAGWFSDGDPVAGKPLSGKANPLKWGFTGDASLARVLCSGLVKGVAWDPDKDFFTRPHRPLEVAIGNSSTDALSALIASQSDLGGNIDCEFLLNALQLGLLTRLHDQADRGAKLDAAMQQDGFGSVAAASVWLVKRAAPAGNGVAQADSVPDTTAMPLAVAHELNALNLLQQQYDFEQSAIASQQQQLFRDWYRYILVLHPGGDLVSDISVDDLWNFLSGELSTLQARQGACGTLQFNGDDCRTDAPAGSLAGQVVAQLGVLDRVLKASGTALARQREPGPRYYQPHDPVILLRGDDVLPPVRYGGDGRFSADGYLPCRLSTELVDRLTRGATVIEGQVLGSIDFAAIPCADDLHGLLAEALLLDPAQAGRIAALLQQQLPTLSAASLTAEVTGWQRTLGQPGSAAGPLATAGHAPCAIGVTTWSDTPWIPLYMEWEVDYFPTFAVEPSLTAQSFPPSVIADHYAFDGENLDLACKTAVPPAAQRVRGTIPLTANALHHLDREIDDILSQVPDKELGDIQHKLRNTPILSQAMSGFNSALLMRHQAIQLDIHDPLEQGDDLTERVAAAVTNHNDSEPLPDSLFAPIRAGFMKLVGLTLIDAFGQAKPVDLDGTRLICARGLAPSGADAKQGNYAYLPPRLTQPARLQFRWLSAADDLVEMNSHPASSPLCGWVLPNYLDDSLVVYDQGGAALGALQLVDGNRVVRWQPVPVAGRPLEAAADQQAAVQSIDRTIADGHLKNFVLGIIDNPAGAALLDNLIRTIDRMLATIVPGGGQSDQSLGILIGRPIAVVRASIDLELSELPAVNQSWPSLQQDIKGVSPGARDTRGFEHVTFEVRLGDAARSGDGLIGYFRHTKADASDYRRFYSPLATQAGGVDLPSGNPILVKVDDAAPAELVTLLMDPRSAVHAASGILPLKSIALPPDQYADAMRNIQAAFLVAPVLGAPTGLALPLPEIAGFEWRWLQAVDGVWQQAPADLPAGAAVTDGGVAPLVKADTTAKWSSTAQTIDEGWLKLMPIEKGAGR